MMTASMRTLLHGEVLVEFRARADAYVPHVGGSAATIAGVAARAGAQVALSGVVGDDPWGHWAVGRLQDDGVSTDRVTFDPEHLTPLAFTTADAAGAPATTLHGRPLAQVPGDADADPDAVVLGADTLTTDDERDRTLALRDRAVQDGRPVVVVATFAPHRWETPAFAASATRELVKGALLVVAGAEEARLLSGEDDPAAAAEGLVAMGAGHAVVATDTGAVLRGGLRAVSRTPRDHATLVGGVLAHLAATGFYPPAIAVALR